MPNRSGIEASADQVSPVSYLGPGSALESLRSVSMSLDSGFWIPLYGFWNKPPIPKPRLIFFCFPPPILTLASLIRSHNTWP